ncbi:hypothetical protein PUN28_008107 [Cardiocondyla obscurior]|uniref:Uncharacterized protein n=1 Tax=Cardiocondyla obscurior TaxID=286306 RepID=A0AAW2FXV4_9HYME
MSTVNRCRDGSWRVEPVNESGQIKFSRAARRRESRNTGVHRFLSNTVSPGFVIEPSNHSRMANARRYRILGKPKGESPQQCKYNRFSLKNKNKLFYMKIVKKKKKIICSKIKIYYFKQQ